MKELLHDWNESLIVQSQQSASSVAGEFGAEWKFSGVPKLRAEDNHWFKLCIMLLVAICKYTAILHRFRYFNTNVSNVWVWSFGETFLIQYYQDCKLICITSGKDCLFCRLVTNWHDLILFFLHVHLSSQFSSITNKELNSSLRGSQGRGTW